MALSKEVYRAFEDIVGRANITDEPAIIHSYAWMYGNDLKTKDRSGFFPILPEAVVLPGSTDEVQAIVRACNRSGTKVKAISTGWFDTAQALSPGTVILDLRRMNRILEIDEKNMVAVVEPYVSGAQLQAEVMKLGLNCHIIGAGAGCSPLASATATIGNGPDSIFMGYSSEVLLSMEWVMPDGEILRTGSLTCGDDWFCGEGPGPSTRGIIRGKTGSTGCARCVYQVRPETRALAWPGGTPGGRDGSCLQIVSPGKHPLLHTSLLVLEGLCRRNLQDLRCRNLLHSPPSVRDARRGPGPRLPEPLQRPDQDARPSG